VIVSTTTTTPSTASPSPSSVLPGVGFDQGMNLANRIHSTGRAVVWSGLKEPAELYWEQLKDLGLTMAPLDRL
jgi:ATP-dependent Clp protease adaptor protein ClpS